MDISTVGCGRGGGQPEGDDLQLVLTVAVDEVGSGRGVERSGQVISSPAAVAAGGASGGLGAAIEQAASARQRAREVGSRSAGLLVGARRR